MLGDAGVDHAKTVEHRVRPLLLDAVAGPAPGAGRAIISITVGDQDRRFLERRDEVDGRMALVVADLNDGRQLLQTELRPHADLQAHGQVEEARRVGLMRVRAQQVEALRGTCEHRADQRAADALHVPRACDHIDIFEAELTRAEDFGHRHARIVDRMLDAVEALLFQHDIRLAVGEQRQSGIMRRVDKTQDVHCSILDGWEAAGNIPAQS